MLKIKRRKSPNPTLEGTMDHFANQFQGSENPWTKNIVGKQALVILSLEIP
jgi:hypothetical protein